MRELPLKALKAGMRVAKPVLSLQGVLLLQEGATLSEKGIWVLKSWGIPSAWIESEGEEAATRAGEAGERSVEDIARGLRERLCGPSDDPVMVAILLAAAKLLHRREHMSAGL